MPVAASTQQAEKPRSPSKPAEQAQPAAQPPAEQPLAAEPPRKRLVMVEPADADLPPVPAEALKRQPVERPRPVETRQDVVISSGTNTLIPISRNQINRLVTPFENPHIQTVSNAEISTSGNVIYVTTQDEQPVTMFVTPEDDESVAISLTLLPQGIPPIQANLIFAQSVPGVAPGGAAMPAMGGMAYSGTAKKWERSQPYMNTLRSLMRELALGGLPPGAWSAPVVVGIAAGLFFGKQAGILGGIALAERLGLAKRPRGASWTQLYGVALLAGIGFTMSLFIGGLAFPGNAEIETEVKLGVLIGSVASALAGYAVLRFLPRRRRRRR